MASAVAAVTTTTQASLSKSSSPHTLSHSATQFRSAPLRTYSSNKSKKETFPDGLPHVLVVDDNDMNRKLLKRMLTQMNLPHLEASHGKEAVNVMLKSRNFSGKREDPRVGMVLMDISMPIMDGYEATETIRSYPDFADLPIVALTAAAEGKDKCFQVGMTEYQTKPIKRELLYKICKRHLKDRDSSSTTIRHNATEDASAMNIQDLLV